MIVILWVILYDCWDGERVMTSPFCISAYLIQEKKFLLIRRCGKYLPGTWQMITGGIHQSETAAQAALREIKEETGIQPDRFYSADAVETFYMPTVDKICFVPVFVAYIEKLAKVQLSPNEHDAYEWLSYTEAKKRLVWTEQKRIISHIYENFILKKPNPILLINE